MRVRAARKGVRSVLSQASTDNVNECDVCGCALLARPPWLREIAYIQWTRCKQA